MMNEMNRRQCTVAALGSAAVGIMGHSASAQTVNPVKKTLIVGVSCSPRKGMTTATGIQAALDAALTVDLRIEVKLLDLGGMQIAGWSPRIEPDDFEQTLPILRAANLGGLIIGSPVYFRSMSALCKAFLERLAVLHKPDFVLADKPAGALSVGSYRNGGQELVISEILNVMLCHEALAVGGRANAFQGATLVNEHKDNITKDELGMESARMLGQRVAEAALRTQI